MKYPIRSLALLLLFGACTSSGTQATRHHTMSSSHQETQVTPPAQALLVLDMQNDFCHPDGKLHGLVSAELARTGVVDATLSLIHAAKERGVPAFVTPILFDYSKSPAGMPEGIAAPIVENRAFDRDGVGGELIDEVAGMIDGESVIRFPKPSLSAFAATDLDVRLREAGVEEVVIAGLVTNYCVESTARDAFDLGYRVRVVGDATAGFDAGQHRFALDTIFPMLGRVITVEDFTGEPASL